MYHFGIAGSVSLRLTESVTRAVIVAVRGIGWDAVGFSASIERELRRELAEYADGDEWLDQRQSPLVGHCATVRARIEAGMTGARIDGDRYLLTTAALAEELANGAI